MIPSTRFDINAYDHACSPYPWSFNENLDHRTVPICWNMEAVKAPARPSLNGHGKHEAQEPCQNLSGTLEESNKADDAILEWHRDRFLESGDTAAYWALTW
jgi:hypothetical protein